ncbi:MAG: ATP-binding protein [Vicinamibacteria bacterium]|jgi:two-component system phosphate regulon sensor histidine kinase PhoR|nr:ATP-binding protein [Vicinamibacteria bacterium]
MNLFGRFGLKRRMAVAAVASSAVALLVVLLIVGSGLRARALVFEREALLAEARLMARVVREPLLRGVESDVLDALVDDATREVRARVTIVALDGRVLADSAASSADLRAMSNHLQRPEVQAALKTGSGSAIRASATTGEELVYAAVAVQAGARLLAVVRVSLALRSVNEQTSELRRAVAMSLLVAFLTTLLLSTLLAGPLIGPLREVMEGARRMARGDLGSRIRVSRRDELGELVDILNVAADQLQQRLNELSRDRARTEAILAAMDEGVLAVDHRGMVVLANEVLHRHFELIDPIGRHYLELIRYREASQAIEGVLADGQRRVSEIEVPHRQLCFALTAVSFPGQAGQPHGAVLTFHDVTERRRLERMRRDFVANASHELRTPLTSISGYVEALEDGALGDPALTARFLGRIRAQTDRMTALANDLLELSRSESDEDQPHWAGVDVRAVAREAALSFAEAAALKGVALDVHGAEAVCITTDREAVRRILENLIDNAIKYTPAAGHVEVDVSRDADGGVAISVRDDGPGIAAEHLPRLFERFYRVDQARSRELGGTGLGLAIARHLSDKLKAHIEVHSEPGQGANFTIVLPSQP